MSTIFDEAIEVAKSGKRFIVVSHVNPEGDALGSLFGLALSLKEMGKDVIAYTEEPVSEQFDFLPGSETAVQNLEGVNGVDATFAVDCGQLDRLGDGFVAYEGKGRVVNMDHHRTNDNFGEVNIVLPEACAAGEIVYDFLKEGGFPINRSIATNLYVAIHTDTGSFRYSTSSAGAFRKAAELVELGADPWDISAKVYESYPVERFKLLGMVLETLEVSEDGRVATLHVSQGMLDRVGAAKDLTDGFVNYTRSIKGVDVGVLFRESAEGCYKISMRSKKGVDVAGVAESFGGGGHTNAAGATVEGTLDDVKKMVLEAIRSSIGKR